MLNSFQLVSSTYISWEKIEVQPTLHLIDFCLVYFVPRFSADMSVCMAGINALCPFATTCISSEDTPATLTCKCALIVNL